MIADSVDPVVERNSGTGGSLGRGFTTSDLDTFVKYPSTIMTSVSKQRRCVSAASSYPRVRYTYRFAHPATTLDISRYSLIWDRPSLMTSLVLLNQSVCVCDVTVDFIPMLSAPTVCQHQVLVAWVHLYVSMS